jgi:hypothetical protein
LSKLQILVDRIQSWQILRHPHVLQVFGISALDADQPLIISQYYPNGNANEFLAKNPAADRGKIVSTAYVRLVLYSQRRNFMKDVRMRPWDAISSWGKLSCCS